MDQTWIHFAWFGMIGKLFFFIKKKVSKFDPVLLTKQACKILLLACIPKMPAVEGQLVVIQGNVEVLNNWINGPFIWLLLVKVTSICLSNEFIYPWQEKKKKAE